MLKTPVLFLLPGVAMLRIRTLVTVGTLLTVAFVRPSLAESTPDPVSTGDDHRAVHERHMKPLMTVASPHDAESGVQRRVPASPGQDAFGAVQEIVVLLEADSATDWSRVKLDALREHLIDMNRVTLEARADVTAVENGVRMDISGSGRTLDAIRRMVPAHALELDRLPQWSTVADTIENGVRLTVTSPDSAEATKIRGLGFIGVMATGGHHQVHHLAMAKGELIH